MIVNKVATSHEKVKISINIPTRLLYDLDSGRAITKQDRSTWVSAAILEKLARIKKEKLEKSNSE